MWAIFHKLTLWFDFLGWGLHQLELRLGSFLILANPMNRGGFI